MFFVNMKIAHRRKLRAMEKSDLEEDDEDVTAGDIKNKKFSWFKRKKKVDSVKCFIFLISGQKCEY